MARLKNPKARKKTTMAARPENRPVNGRRRLVLGAALLCAVALVWGVWQTEQAAIISPQFRVAALEVRGLRLLSGEQVLAASGVEVGDGLFEVDLDTVAQRLDRLVWVRSVRIERKPPDRLVVHLEERRRVAWVEWRSQQHGIDATGVLLPPEKLPTEGIDDLDLPILRVPGLSDSLVVGEVVADSVLQRLLSWWSLAQRLSPRLAGDISQVEPYDGEALVLRLVADNLEVRVPYGQVAERLLTLHEVLGRVYSECPNPAYVDLRFAGQAVVGRPSPRGPDNSSSPGLKPQEADSAPPARRRSHG